jgi:hypothetical protein
MMLYVARFSFDQQQKGKDDEIGSFEVLVEAENAENAAETCKPYLTAIVQKEKRDAFGGKVVMYLDDLFEVTAPLSTPALINFRVHPADGFSEIFNPMLDGPPEVTPYRWGDPEDENKQEPFMTFEPGPQRVRVEGAKKSKPVGKKTKPR